MTDIVVSGNTATFDVTGTYDSLVVKLNGTELELDKDYTNNSGKITVDISGISKTKFDISVEAKIQKYAVKYRILEKDTSQRLMVVTDVKDASVTANTTKTFEFKTDVSLQKYITHVNGAELTTLSDETTTLKDRKNQMTELSDDTTKVKEKISSKPVVNEVNSSSKQYKKGDDTGSNAVNIKRLDTVTYKIEVYNNSDTDATNIKVRDSFPLEVSAGKFEIISIYRGGEGGDPSKDIKSEWQDDKDTSTKNTYEYTISSLPAGTSTYFDVTVKFCEYSKDILVNFAWINKVDQKNLATHRILDRDYVKLENPYRVSLEKYISAVNGVSTTDRDGKAEYLTEVSGSYVDETEKDSVWTQHNTYKKDNIVTVNTGDIVTYTIKVKNDGAIPVTITKIVDYLPNGIKYNGTEYKGTEYNTQTTNSVEFTNVEVTKDGTTKTELNKTELQPSESAYFTIEVEVIESSLSMNILKNVAEITEIENNTVQDLTLNNNKDADYIQLGSTPVVPKTSYTVEKVWTGSTTTPAQVTVKLFKVESGKEIDLGLESVVLSDANGWQYKWDNLDEGITYIARELNEAGTKVVKGTDKYNSMTNTTYTEITNGIKITNNYTQVTPPDPEKTSYTVEKVWDDDNNPDRPKKVTVKLYKVKEDGGLEDLNKDIKLDIYNWTYTWDKLPKYVDDSKELIVYTAREIDDDGNIIEESNKLADYTAHYLHSGNKTTITNKKDTPPPSSDLTISGIVWNDKALDKTASSYNGKKDEQETGISGVKVMLHRIYDGTDKGVVATTYTDHDGKYSFTKDNLDSRLPEDEKYIRGPKSMGAWVGKYYSYYVIFEYDGITYTSTNYTDFTSNDSLDSNAKEDHGKVEKNRTDYNTQFSKINKDGIYDKHNNKIASLDYSTTNEDGYIPQSIHKYNESTMKIQSSTSLIELKNDVDLVQKIKHINLGLKGRDVFDLELTSDVNNVKVTVNGVDGEYNYSNKVTVRREDIKGYNYLEDSANPYIKGSYYEDGSYDQKIRTSDFADTGLGIQVTYKITVKNASETPGTATKITNYYDSNYKEEGVVAYYYKTELDKKNDNKTWIDDKDITDGKSGSGYKSKVIKTPGTILNQSEKMEIYVVYTLNDAVNTLKDITDKMATYNMAEIFEYRTEAKTSADEATRGLIDKDSAPGSANTENVRLYPDLVEDGKSTVKYYFEAKDLNKLKYEDHTYATPTLYFVKDGSQRTLTGIVFEDLTTVDSGSRIKTGNGILDTDKGEVGIYGATVKLIEITGSGNVERYTTSTLADNPGTVENELGTFEFSGFLPGNYMIEYHYGDKIDTVLLGQAGEKINKQSYNGEDYQATNNTGKKGEELVEGLYALNTTPEYWYVFNEKVGVSTATDNGDRRNTVNNNIVSMASTEEGIRKLDTLNDMRDYVINKDTLKTTHEWNSEKTVQKELLEDQVKTINGTEITKIIDATKMDASTKGFLVSVEKTTESEGTIKESNKFGDYLISNMNFGIAEVPVTTVDLNKFVSGFTITDSTGSNILAKAGIVDGVWKLEQGNVKYIPSSEGTEYDPKITAEIEDEKLQGARLEITYTISKYTYTEKNFDGTSVAAKANITGLVDFVDNNLSYNEALGDNARYWELISEDDLKTKMEGLKGSIYNNKATTESVVLRDESRKYNTILKLKEDIRFFEITEGTEAVTITLEKILSSTNSTIDELLAEVVDASVYSNTVEITNWDYPGVTDRIRTSDRHIILPGISESASETSEILVIHPPTGTNFNILYLVIAVISLAVLAGGVFGIKKFVIKK